MPSRQAPLGFPDSREGGRNLEDRGANARRSRCWVLLLLLVLLADPALALKMKKQAVRELEASSIYIVQADHLAKPSVFPTLKHCYAPDDRSADSGQMPEQHALHAESKRQEVLQLDNEIDYNEAIIEEWEQAIQDIQEQIGEVHEIFKDLATLVHSQGVVIEEIDTNLENSAAATKEAKTEVAKASKTQKSNSSPGTVTYPSKLSILSTALCLLMVIFEVVLLVVIIVLAAWLEIPNIFYFEAIL